MGLTPMQLVELANRFEESEKCKTEPAPPHLSRRGSLRKSDTGAETPGKGGAPSKKDTLRSSMSKIRCFGCKELGHISRECPRKQRSGEVQGGNIVVGKVSMALENRSRVDPNFPRVRLPKCATGGGELPTVDIRRGGQVLQAVMTRVRRSASFVGGSFRRLWDLLGGWC